MSVSQCSLEFGRAILLGDHEVIGMVEHQGTSASRGMNVSRFRVGVRGVLEWDISPWKGGLSWL